MDDDRSSNVAGAEGGAEASPAPKPREMAGREADLAAKTLRARDLTNEPAPRGGREPDGDVDRRP